MTSYIMNELSSESTSRIYQALKTVRTNFIRNALQMEQFQKEGIVKLLISFMEQPKLCNVALSILATSCLQNGFRREVIENGGISALTRILKGLANDEILNRVVRAIGNIAVCRHGTKELRKFNVIRPLLCFLTSTQDGNCQQSVLRTLRILGEDPEQKTIIISSNGIYIISGLLSSKNEEVLKVCVKSLASLTRSCTIESASQIQKADILPALVNLYNNTCKEIGRYALIIFENLTCQAPMIESLSNNKVLEIFIKEVTSAENDVKTIQAAALSLCLCCKHYRNRDEIRKLGGLPILIDILKDNSFVGIQTEILPALVLLCSEINDLDKLRELRLLPVCIELLKNYVSQNKREHDYQRKKQGGTLGMKCSPKRGKSISVSDAKVARSTSNSGSNDAVFSIHSPTYQGLQLSEPSTSGTYRSYASPLNTIPINPSPDFSYDWNPSSPLSCSSPLGPWSPGSSNNDHEGMCWSPVMSSHSNTPDSSPGHKDSVNDVINLSDLDDNSPEIHPQVSNSEDKTQPVNVVATASISSPSTSRKQDEKLSLNIADLVKKPLETVKKRKYSELNSDSNDSLRSQPVSEFESILSSMSSPGSNKHLQVKESKPSSKSVDHCILTLLAHLAYNLEKTSNSEIVEEINVGVLIDYVAQLPSPDQKASKILYSLISNRYSFEKLIMCNFIGQVETRIDTPHDIELCRRCHRLMNIKKKLMLMGRLIAESEFGVGALIHVMVTTDTPSQLNCLYAIGKLVESKKLLLRIFFDSRGFKILKQYLSSERKSDFKIAVQCLSMISLSIAGRYRRFPSKKRTAGHRTCKFGNNSFDLTILLDDGTSVSASREQLTSSCEFFSVMLEGRFVESSQNVVSLPSISENVLLLILHLLHGCSVETCIYWEYLDANILLQVLEASERFLLPAVKSVVQEKIIDVIEDDDIFAFYSTAKIYSPKLMTSVLHFLLCSSIATKKEYYKVLRTLIELEDGDFFKSLKAFLKGNLMPQSS